MSLAARPAGGFIARNASASFCDYVAAECAVVTPDCDRSVLHALSQLQQSEWIYSGLLGLIGAAICALAFVCCFCHCCVARL